MNITRMPFTLACLALLSVFAVAATPAQSADRERLRPVDTSSPRATLQGFIETLDASYLSFSEVIDSYRSSGRLYLNGEERHRQQNNLQSGLRAVQFLDTSQISPVLRTTVSAERSIQL